MFEKCLLINHIITKIFKTFFYGGIICQIGKKGEWGGGGGGVASPGKEGTSSKCPQLIAVRGILEESVLNWPVSS